jgi:arylsulfatase A-like enzyme
VRISAARNDVPGSWRKTFWLSLALSCVLMLVSYARVIPQYSFVFLDDKVLASVVDVPLWGTKLGGQILRFVIAQLVLYGLFGTCAWVLARLSEYAFRPTQTTPNILVLAWFLLLTIAVFVGNVYLIPWGLLGEYFADMVATTVFGIAVGQIVLGLAGLMILATLGMAMLRFLAGRGPHLRLSAGLAMLVACIAIVAKPFVQQAWSGSKQHTAEPSRPNIILIGIDSLRPDYTSIGGDVKHTPNVNEFLRHARVFKDTTTPLSRTFPSWITTLTGRHPHDTGAMMNLTNRASIDTGPTLADVLRKQGYRTTFAIDEVRFANIDESYGFDQIITPPMGASDFLLASINDTPLANLVADTAIGRLLFPNSYANRAAAHVYQPQSFSRRLEAELRLEPPFFLAAHFTLPHYPYYWAEAPRYKPDDTPHQGQSLYGETIRAADAQVGRLMEFLQRTGALENAIVVVLSDHGEGLSAADILLTEETRRFGDYKIPAQPAGHGISVLTPAQYQVVFAVRGFGRAPLSGLPAATFETPATLEDVTPTLLDLQQVAVADTKFTGISLADILRGQKPDGDALAKQRIRFTETEFNPPALVAGFNAEEVIAKQSAKYYHVDPATGRLSLRDSKLAEAMEDRQYAAMDDRFVLAALPFTGVAYKYALVAKDRSQPPMLADGIDGLAGNPQAVRLWNALQQRFRLEETVASKLAQPMSHAADAN